MKIDSTWTSILRQIDVDLILVCSKKYCVFWKDCCVCFAIKIKCKHNFMFLAKLFETC